MIALLQKLNLVRARRERHERKALEAAEAKKKADEHARLSKKVTIGIIKFSYVDPDNQKKVTHSFWAHCQIDGYGKRSVDVKSDKQYRYDSYEQHAYYVSFIQGWLGGYYSDADIIAQSRRENGPN